MKYDPNTHHRRSTRLKDYDYSQAGAYFVTICTQNRQCLFGEIVDREMRLNHLGHIANDQWNAIPQRFPMVELDEFVVMPNHIHGIITIVGAPLAGAQNSMPLAGAPIERAAARAAPTVGDIVGAYKSLCVHHGLSWIKQHQPNRMLGKLWQRNYYEHIIRNEREINRIREYIRNNQAQWELDKLYPGTSGSRTDLNETQEPSAGYTREAWMV